MMKTPADVTDLDAVQSAVARLVETWGRLDVLFNNAGIFTPTRKPLLKRSVPLTSSPDFLKNLVWTSTAVWLSPAL